MKLTNNQKKYLRSLAHNLKPVVMVGKQGLSEALLLELQSSMEVHELLKIKVRAASREEKQAMIEKIVAFSQAAIVQVIGSVLVIYRPFAENPVIAIPRK